MQQDLNFLYQSSRPNRKVYLMHSVIDFLIIVSFIALATTIFGLPHWFESKFQSACLGSFADQIDQKLPNPIPTPGTISITHSLLANNDLSRTPTPLPRNSPIPYSSKFSSGPSVRSQMLAYLKELKAAGYFGSPKPSSPNVDEINSLIRNFNDLKNKVDANVIDYRTYTWNLPPTTVIGSTTGTEIQGTKLTIDNIGLDGNTITTSTGDLTVTPAGNTIFSNGNVGIGTTTPTAALELHDRVSTGGNLAVVASISNTFGVLNAFGIKEVTIGGVFSAANFAALTVRARGAANLTIASFETSAGTEMARVALNGVGEPFLDLLNPTTGIASTSLGTNNGAGSYFTSPLSIRALTSFQPWVLQLQAKTANGTLIQMKNSTGTTVATFNGSGYLGIGETTPETPIDVAGNILASNSGNVDLTLNSTTNQDSKFILRSFGSATNARFGILSSASTELFTIASSGNVGIGTTSPTSKLTINRNTVQEGFFAGTTPTEIAVTKTFTSFVIAGVFQSLWDFPAGGGGTGTYYFSAETASTSTQNMTGNLTALVGMAQHLGTGTANNLIGLKGLAQNRSSNTVTLAQAIIAQPGIPSPGITGTILTAQGVNTGLTLAGGGVSNSYGFYSGRLVTTGGVVRNMAGVAVEHLTQATNNTAILIASTSSNLNIPAGNFGIYNASPYSNYTAGSIGIGTTNIDSKFELVGGTGVTTATVASLSGTSLTTGSLLSLRVPPSSSFSGPILVARDTNNLVLASLSSGGRFSIRRDIFSHGAVSNCTSVGTPSAGCLDYAESFPTSDPSLSAGDIVAVDPLNPSHVLRAQGSPSSASGQFQSPTVIGIVSTNPASLIDDNAFKTGANAQASPDTVSIALVGRVPVKISLENGPIAVGDHLTISKTLPGYAMKATEAGTSVGIALEPVSELASGSQKSILIFVNLGYWAPAASSSQAQVDIVHSINSDLLSGIIEYFKEVILTVKGLVADTIESRSIKTEKFCLDDVCVDKQQLQQLLDKNGIMVNPNETQATPTPTPEVTASPTPDITPTPSETPIPTPEPTPSATPEPTPTPS